MGRSKATPRQRQEVPTEVLGRQTTSVDDLLAKELDLETEEVTPLPVVPTPRQPRKKKKRTKTAVLREVSFSDDVELIGPREIEWDEEGRIHHTSTAEWTAEGRLVRILPMTEVTVDGTGVVKGEAAVRLLWDLVGGADGATLAQAVARGILAMRIDDQQLCIYVNPPQRSNRLLFQVMALLFPGSILSDHDKKARAVTAQEVYAVTDNVQWRGWKSSGKPLVIPGLVPTLRPYQQAAVEWMIQREQNPPVSDEYKLGWVRLEPDGTVAGPDDEGVLWNPFLGCMWQDEWEPPPPVRGGILADSMGLGKTVEVLACVLGHRRLLRRDEPEAKRKLDFNTPPDESPTEDDKYLNDMASFVDADEDSDEDLPTTTVLSGPTSANLITPPAMDERFVEEDCLGSCICGNLVEFRDAERSPVVFCTSCDEPMHMVCAGFDSERDMEPFCTPVMLRQMFSDRSARCAVSKDGSLCPCCVGVKGTKFPSRATLIVTPSAILGQWERELARHASLSDGSKLNVLVYHGYDRTRREYGVRKNGVAQSMRLLHPRFYQDVDIVLITFEALSADLGHTDEAAKEGNSKLRKRKRYRIVPSPLCLVDWWRVCLDEAQRVETPTAASAQMALRLDAQHRWCVTGTPIGKGKLDDLYGLLLFLRLAPFDDQSVFKRCFLGGHRGLEQRLSHLLGNAFWRSTKNDEGVARSMNIPPQIQKKVILQFSSIEKHFYARQLDATLNAVGDVLSNKRATNRKLEHLAEHLHRLRAACCHPQVGASGVSAGRKSSQPRRGDATASASNIGSRVMTMEQILDRFVDDSRLKCEEAQRLVILHTNAMAATARLKVEAKSRGVTTVKETDKKLLQQSCDLYDESMKLAEENSTPSALVAEAHVSGSTGFFSTEVPRRGSFKWNWKRTKSKSDHVWARVDFEGAARRLVEIRVRPIGSIPEMVEEDSNGEFRWTCLHPRTCVLQCSDTAVGGEFVDVVEFTIPLVSNPDDWKAAGSFMATKSKSWRFLVRDTYEASDHDSEACMYLGIEVDLLEAYIASDPLQRLHCLHNSSLTLRALSDTDSDSSSHREEQARKQTEEALKIENLYLGLAHARHKQCGLRMADASEARVKLDSTLLQLAKRSKKKGYSDCWDEGWWDDFLVYVQVSASDTQQTAVLERLVNDLDTVVSNTGILPGQGSVVAFPPFNNLQGFRTALQMRLGMVRSGLGAENKRRERSRRNGIELIEDDWKPLTSTTTWFRCSEGAHASAMKQVARVSIKPTDDEVFENSHCGVCKADWQQTGPKCRHCKLEDQLNEIVPDVVTLQVLRSVWSVIRSSLGGTILARSGLDLDGRAKVFFDLMEAADKEWKAAKRLWRVHLDLLNNMDELNQCKMSMRLTYDGENLSELTDEQLNSIVVPIDVGARFHDHAAKQAMAYGDLRRAKDTLRFLRNQSSDHHDTCVVCLNKFDTDRAVLRCGHSFHWSPCLDRLTHGGMITCPLRCSTRTSRDEVMIAGNAQDGSKSLRPVKGSWGTKVTRLVADVMDVRDAGDKCLIFSQWEDMLDIVQEALNANQVGFVRAPSLRRMGECTDQFRLPTSTALLLNVKNGAEGLTLIEATHIFMIEPLLNHGLDSQAISRIHRIGQSRRTYVHRYLVADTVETKIDALREEHSGENLEDSIQSVRSSQYRAGGIDGGFSKEELLDLLQLE